VTRVLIVGRRRLGLEGLESILGQRADLQVTGLTTALDETPAAPADVVVVDAAGINAAWIESALSGLQRSHPDAKKLVLVENADDPALIAAIDAGADGCLDAQAGGAGLCEAIHDLARDRFSLGPELTRKLLHRVRDGEATASKPSLTNREMQVLREIGAGSTNLQVSRTLSISESTVKNHLYSIYRKLGATSRSQALSEAFRRGMITP